MRNGVSCKIDKNFLSVILKQGVVMPTQTVEWAFTVHLVNVSRWVPVGQNGTVEIQRTNIRLLSVLAPLFVMDRNNVNENVDPLAVMVLLDRHV